VGCRFFQRVSQGYRDFDCGNALNAFATGNGVPATNPPSPLGNIETNTLGGAQSLISQFRVSDLSLANRNEQLQRLTVNNETMMRQYGTGLIVVFVHLW
jgi:hypothetical protein